MKYLLSKYGDIKLIHNKSKSFWWDFIQAIESKHFIAQRKHESKQDLAVLSIISKSLGRHPVSSLFLIIRDGISFSS